jgi:hypothetical protein
MFSEVLDALKLVGDAVSGARRLSDEDRNKLGSYCDNIATVIRNFVDARHDRSKSINLCAELREYVQPLRSLASGRLASEEIDRLATALDGVCHVWSQAHSRVDAGFQLGERDLDDLVKAEGTFRGMANRLRAT